MTFDSQHQNAVTIGTGPPYIKINFNKMIFKTFFLTFFTVAYTVRCSTLNESKQLVADLLEDYDKKQRPVLNQSEPVKVECEFILKAIQDFSEVEGVLKVRGTLYMEWTDQSLIWNATQYGNLRSFPFPVRDLWYPKILLINSFSEPSPVGKNWMNIRVANDGKARFFGLEIFEVSCGADVTYFPFDTQTCRMIFISFSNSFNEVHLLTKASAADDPNVKQALENKQWVLENVTTRRVLQPKQPDLIVTTIVIKRLPIFLVVNIFLPVICLAVINILVFLLPPESGERISFSVTILLALAVYMTIIENNLPKIAQPLPWICYYVVSVLILSVLICVATIFNLQLFHKTNTENIPLCCRRLVSVFCKIGEKPQISHQENKDEDASNTDEEVLNETGSRVTWQDISFVVDKIFFICFLLTILAYNILYFTMSLSKSKETKTYSFADEVFGSTVRF